MNPIKEIEINGVKRKALFSVFLWKRLQDEGIQVELRTDTPQDDLHGQLSATTEFIKIIYGGLRNAIESGVEENYDLKMVDVDLWATSNMQLFYEMINYVVQTLTTGQKTKGEQVVSGSKKKNFLR